LTINDVLLIWCRTCGDLPHSNYYNTRSCRMEERWANKRKRALDMCS